MKKSLAALLLFLAFHSKLVSAQTDTLKLDIQTAENLFVNNNRDLLAAYYNIDEAKAEIITAKLFDNPHFEYENVFYNRETSKFLQTSSRYGQYTASISQLIKLAGKRNKNIRQAETSLRTADLAYFDLLRSLRFELRSLFYETYFLSGSVSTYNQQIKSTEQLLKIYVAQLDAGNVALKDIVRIRALVINLKAELEELLNNLANNHKELRLLCGLSVYQPISIIIDETQSSSPVLNLSLASLIDSAKANRADLQLAKTSVLSRQHNLSLQKANAIPDIELSLSYDMKGNYPEKYTGLGISVPLPLFNRNQGEIKKAQIEIGAAQNILQQKESLIENEVFTAYGAAVRIEKLYDDIDQSFDKDFGILISSLIQNLNQRHISLLEFLDLYDAFKENMLQINNLRLKKMNAREEINYVTGSKILK